MSTCPDCGGIDHHMPDCWIGNGTLPTVVYDLAEFERSLERKRHDLISVGEREALVAVRCVLDALKSSRKP